MLFLELADDADEATINRYLDARVRADVGLFALAQAAGGRWLIAGGELVFTAW